MKRKDGGVRIDYDTELDKRILDALFEKKFLNVERLRDFVNKRYDKEYGWITIKRHLNYLRDRDLVKIFYETEEGKRKIRVYQLNK